MHVRRTLAALTAAVTVSILGGGLAQADDISNSLDGTIDAVAEVMPLNVGGVAGTTTLYVSPANNDGKNGCNLTGTSTLTLALSSSNTAVATVLPSAVTFTSCGDVKTLTITAVAQGTATISASQTSNSTGGTFDLAPATFTVNVAPPANTAPSVSVTGVSAGATYTYGAVPDAACSVTDAEDSDEAATLSVTGPASHIGAFLATCTYTDQGGIEASSSVSYTVEKAPSTVRVTCPSSEQYTGAELESCEATVTGVDLSAGLPVAYVDNVNVGTATATAKFTGDDHHLGSTGSATFAITAAESQVTVSCPSSVTFDGSAQTPCTAKATGIGGLDEELDVTYAANVSAGTATASASFPGDANHAGSDGSATFEISKAPAVVSIDCGTGPYTYTAGAQEPCSASVTGAGGLSESLTLTYSNNTDAGTATAAASFEGDDNHEAASSSTTFQIVPAQVTVTVTCDVGPFVFDGDAHEPCSAAVEGPGLDTTVAVDYANNVNAGTAGASALFPTGGNYVGSSDSKTFEIEKADSVTHIACPADVPWDGTSQEPCTATVTGPGGLDEALTVAYSGNSEVGTASASAVFTGGSNHNGSRSDTTFEIVKAQSTTTVTCAPTSIVYSGAPHTPCTARVVGAGGLDLPVALSYADNINAGIATATATWPGDEHHLPSSETARFGIMKAPTATMVSCPAGVDFTGSAITPCTATVTGAGGLSQSLSVSYANNTAVGMATAAASFPGGNNHWGSTDTKTFQIMAWTLGGFYQPVDMGNVLNTVKNGSTVPLKFEVFSGSTELRTTSAVKGFTVKGITCGTGDATDDVELTTTGGTSLRFDASGDQFIQNWQTPKKAGVCYEVTMTTIDNTSISAKFKLK